MWRRLCAWIALLALCAGPATAKLKDAVYNKEGVWGIDVDHGACAATMLLKDGGALVLRGADGDVGLFYFAPRKLPSAKTARLETEAYGFDFKPGYGEKGRVFFMPDPLDARAVAALRLGHEVRLLADGRQILAVTLENTGVEGALDGLIACSKGESGWWGKGVQVAGAEPAPEPTKAEPERPLNKEGFWSLAASDDACTALAQVEGGGGVVLIAVNEGRDIVVGVGSDAGFRRGRRGRLEADAYRFDFKPSYGGKDYMQLDQFLDSEALFQLRRAKDLRITVDGAEVLSLHLEGTGFEDLLKSLAACGRGEKGWWGEGAAARR